MKNTIFAAVAALTLAIAAAPAFAANHGGNNQGAARSDSSNIQSQCDNILANPAGYASGDVRACHAAE